jgi:predicted alpha/beta hydrolase family esterase
MRPTVLIVPGLRDDSEDRWQTLLANKIEDAVIVPPLHEDQLWLAARVASLNAAIGKLHGPVLLVAHGAGVMITVHWAQHHDREIQGALLIAPTDLESPLPLGYPPLEAIRDNGWIPIPRQKLRFPAIVAASTNDPLGHIERVAEYASAWGARLAELGPVGHLDAATAFGDWARVETLLPELSGAR